LHEGNDRPGRAGRREGLEVARTKFPVEVLTPDGEVFADEVEMISTRTAVGSIGVLANHAPMLAMLDPSELRLYKSDSDVVRLAQGEGYLRERLQHAETELSEAGEDSERRRVAERDKRRCETFIQIAETA